MEIQVKSVNVLKEGTNDYGPWKLVKVVTESGEYTTLAKEADLIPIGSTVEISNMDEKEGKKSFKKFEITSESTMTSSEKTVEPPLKEKPTKDRDAQIMEAMWYKELGECIRTGAIEKHWPNTHVRITSGYFREMAKHTGVKFSE